MGEYLADPAGRQVAKLGTCQHFMYTRRDELEALTMLGYTTDSAHWALDTDTEKGGAIFRFPWPDEDHDARTGYGIADAINRREPFPYHEKREAEAKLPRDLAPGPDQHSLAQVRPNGRERFNVYASVPCPVGMMTTAGSWPVYIVGERTSAPFGKRTVVECVWCRRLFSLTQDQVDAIGWIGPDPEAVRGRLAGIAPEVDG